MNQNNESNKIVIAKRSKTEHNESLKQKKCAFPECNEMFSSTGAARYCLMHRDKKYRKIIDKSDCVRKSKNTILKKKIENANQIIKHTFYETQALSLKCGLDGCNNQFKVDLIQGINIYPKYCSCHRNQYQRELFTSRL
jgi:hypothetical protein